MAAPCSGPKFGRRPVSIVLIHSDESVSVDDGAGSILELKVGGELHICILQLETGNYESFARNNDIPSYWLIPVTAEKRATTIRHV
jgi:hypothetical protein